MAKNKLGTNAGQFYTECGKDRSGKVPRFYLGRVGEVSEDTARLRRARVRAFWERSQQGVRAEHERNVWLDSDLISAKQVGKGAETIEVGADADPTQRQVLSVTTRVVEALNRRFAGIVHFVLSSHIIDYVNAVARRVESATPQRAGGGETEADGETLHRWLDAYATHALDSLIEIDEDTQEHESSEWAKVFSESVRRIKRWADDVPLSRFGYVQLEEVVRRIASRPVSTKLGRPISVKYAKATLKALRRFVRWLPKRAPWKKPDDWEDIFEQYRPTMTKAEKSEKPIGKVAAYTPDQLVTIYRYATPFERCLFLLAVNCGFGAAELSGLRLREIDLCDRYHGYIRRVRLKTQAGVYGEHWLFPHTVLALEWATARAKTIKENLNPASFVILRDSGKRLVTKTEAGNRSNKAANAWQRLTERIRADLPEFPALSFGKLRKTAGNLVKAASDGETVAVFHQRSSAVESDDEAEVYTDRLYQRVFEAQRKVCARLRPVFDAVPNPFPEKPTKNYIGLKKIDQIKKLWAEGQKAEKIMVVVGVSRATAYRYKPVPMEQPSLSAP